MTHSPETGTINQLHFFGTGFWYVCHSFKPGTRFWRQLEHCFITGQKVVYMWLKWWLMITAYILVYFLAAI